MKITGITRSDIFSFFALLVSIASLSVSYWSYREATITNFSIKLEPSFYLPLKFTYLGRSIDSGFEIDLDKSLKTDKPVQLDKLKPHEIPAQATITFPLTIKVTNNGRRSLPIKKGYYYVVNQKDKTSSRLNFMSLKEASRASQETSTLTINIPPGEVKALQAEISVPYHGEIADQLKVIFDQPYLTAFKTKIDRPSLTRLNFFAIASRDRGAGNSPYPFLSEEYIGLYTILVGVEDLTSNHATQTLKFTFPYNEFFSFMHAIPGEATGFLLHPEERSRLGLPPPLKDNKGVIVTRENMLSTLDSLVGFREALCCNEDGSFLAQPRGQEPKQTPDGVANQGSKKGQATFSK